MLCVVRSFILIAQQVVWFAQKRHILQCLHLQRRTAVPYCTSTVLHQVCISSLCSRQKCKICAWSQRQLEQLGTGQGKKDSAHGPRALSHEKLIHLAMMCRFRFISLCVQWSMTFNGLREMVIPMGQAKKLPHQSCVDLLQSAGAKIEALRAFAQQEPERLRREQLFMSTLQAGIEKARDYNDPVIGCLCIHSKLYHKGREVDVEAIRRDFKDLRAECGISKPTLGVGSFNE